MNAAQIEHELCHVEKPKRTVKTRGSARLGFIAFKDGNVSQGQDQRVAKECMAER